MKLKKELYQQYVKEHAKPSPIFKNCIFAFLIGGSICIFAELLCYLYSFIPAIPSSFIPTLASITLIFISVLLTGLSLYDKIAKIAGAGTLVPITGFANAMSSASLEFKTEGLIFGTSVKLFSVVGPVVVNGVVWSTLAGIVHLLIFGRY